MFRTYTGNLCYHCFLFENSSKPMNQSKFPYIFTKKDFICFVSATSAFVAEKSPERVDPFTLTPTNRATFSLFL